MNDITSCHPLSCFLNTHQPATSCHPFHQAITASIHSLTITTNLKKTTSTEKPFATLSGKTALSSPITWLSEPCLQASRGGARFPPVCAGKLLESLHAGLALRPSSDSLGKGAQWNAESSHICITHRQKVLRWFELPHDRGSAASPHQKPTLFYTLAL